MEPMTVPDMIVTVVHKYGPLKTARSGARPGVGGGPGRAGLALAESPASSRTPAVTSGRAGRRKSLGPAGGPKPPLGRPPDNPPRLIAHMPGTNGEPPEQDGQHQHNNYTD